MKSEQQLLMDQWPFSVSTEVGLLNPRKSSHQDSIKLRSNTQGPYSLILLLFMNILQAVWSDYRLPQHAICGYHQGHIELSALGRCHTVPIPTCTAFLQFFLGPKGVPPLSLAVFSRALVHKLGNGSIFEEPTNYSNSLRYFRRVPTY